MCGCGSTVYSPGLPDSSTPVDSVDSGRSSNERDAGGLSSLDGATTPVGGAIEVIVGGIADPTKVGTPLDIKEIAIDSGAIYVIGNSLTGAGSRGFLIRTAIATPTESRALFSVEGGLEGLAIGAGVAYVGTSTGSGGRKIVQVPLAGGNASDFEVSIGSAERFSIATNGRQVYWTSGPTISGRLTSSGPATIVQVDARSSSAGVSRVLCADQGSLYWVNDDGIVSAPTSGSGPVTNVVAGRGYVFGQPLLSIDSTQLYFGTTAGVFATTKTGGNAVVIASIASNDVNFPSALATDAQYVWWTTKSGRVVRARKP